jgi:hypothetical protein
VSQPLRGAIEPALKERLTGDTELAEIETGQVGACRVHEARCFLTADSRRADGDSRAPLLHCLQEELSSVRHFGFGAA